jgi:uncharacterized protein YbjT (DUF2867 family)
MYIVLGATGHIGSAVAASLLRAGAAVTVVTRDAKKAASWRMRGAEAAVLDMTDVDALRDVFKRGRRAFLLNPPAPPDTDTDAQEHRTLAAIAHAVEGSGLEKIVLESTYGARHGDRLGDLSVLYDFERALLRQAIPVTVLRAAYYMSNWDPLLESARHGVLPSMYPADVAIPMVAPADVAVVAAGLLQESPERNGTHHVEGPARYTSVDVASAFEKTLGRDVKLEVTPREGWETAFRKLGFSVAAAAAYARMTAISVDGDIETPNNPERGTTTLSEYIDQMVYDRERKSGQQPHTHEA